MVMKRQCVCGAVIIAVWLFAAMGLSNDCMAGSYTINPTADGSVYSNGGVSAGAYLLCDGSIQAVAKFNISTIHEEITSATLSVNPYGLPIWGSTLHVYGFSGSSGALSSSDYNAGTFIGDWQLPSLGYGQDAFFDVTGFLKGVTGQYAAFNLRSNGTDVFSSNEYNYGHPAQLHVATVPEPMTLVLLGLGGMVVRRRLCERVKVRT
jgi:hypothetical protein